MIGKVRRLPCPCSGMECLFCQVDVKLTRSWPMTTHHWWRGASFWHRCLCFKANKGKRPIVLRSSDVSPWGNGNFGRWPGPVLYSVFLNAGPFVSRKRYTSFCSLSVEEGPSICGYFLQSSLYIKATERYNPLTSRKSPGKPWKTFGWKRITAV